MPERPKSLVLTAANDNPDGKQHYEIEMRKLVSLLARAYVAERVGKEQSA